MRIPNVRSAIAAPSTSRWCVRPSDRSGHSASYISPGPPQPLWLLLLLLLLLILVLQPRHPGAVALDALQPAIEVSATWSGSANDLPSQHRGTSLYRDQSGEAIGQQPRVPYTNATAYDLGCPEPTLLPAALAQATSPRQKVSVPHPGREPGPRSGSGRGADAGGSAGDGGSGSGSRRHSGG
ncbi:hypothetical protein Vafri_7050, partial [Volvox africanus]